MTHILGSSGLQSWQYAASAGSGCHNSAVRPFTTNGTSVQLAMTQGQEANPKAWAAVNVATGYCYNFSGEGGRGQSWVEGGRSEV